MNACTHWSLRLLAALACASSAIFAASCFEPTQARGPWFEWTRLRLDARSVPLLSGKVEMQVVEEVGLRRLETHTVARFLGARIADSRTETRIDPATGWTRSYVSQSKKRARRYTFGVDAYTAERLMPVNGPDAPLDRWDVTSSASFPYPEDDSGKRVPVFDYYGMLLHLRNLDLHRVGDESTIYVANSDGPAPYRIVVAEVRDGEHTVEDLGNGGERMLPARELRLRVIPADPERADEGFMNMEGETEIWVEAESKTLLMIRGKVRKVPGHVKLVLDGLG